MCSVVLKLSSSEHSRHLEAGGDALHLGIVQFLRLGGGFLHRIENGFLKELFVFLQKFRIEGDCEKLAGTVDLCLLYTSDAADE